MADHLVAVVGECVEQLLHYVAKRDVSEADAELVRGLVVIMAERSVPHVFGIDATKKHIAEASEDDFKTSNLFVSQILFGSVVTPDASEDTAKFFRDLFFSEIQCQAPHVFGIDAMKKYFANLT